MGLRSHSPAPIKHGALTPRSTIIERDVNAFVYDTEGHMPIDPTTLPALERELEYAKHTRPGGQPPSPGRIKAIEEQILQTKAAIARAKGAPTETADAKPAKVEEKAVVADTPEKPDAPAKPEKAV